jgi:hypothetical protein
MAGLAPVPGLLVVSANNPLRKIPPVKLLHWGDFGGIVHITPNLMVAYSPTVPRLFSSKKDGDENPNTASPI